jgi:putative ABC transport system permease protein
MKALDILQTANANLLRNKARTGLTIIAIIIGSTTLSLTNGIGAGIKTYLNKQVGNLGNGNSLTITAATKGSAQPGSSSELQRYTPGQKKIAADTNGPPNGAQVALTQTDIDKIKKNANIVSVTPLLNVTPDYIATTSNPADKYQFTISQTVGTSTLDMSQGQGVSNADNSYQVTIPASYARSLGFGEDVAAIGQQVSIAVSDATGKQSSYTATITGVQQKSLVGSSTAYANDALLQKLHDTESTGLPASTKDAYASVAAVIKSGLTDAQVQTIKDNLKTQGYTAKTVKDQVSTLFTIITAITYVFDGFAGITLIAAAFGIVNTLYMSVSERTKEIGLMKALGLGRRKIFTLFSIEAILIGFWGSVLGIGFANLIGALVNAVTSKGFLKDFDGLHLLSFPFKASATIVIGIMLIAFLAGTLPARRASQKDPIEALRYE